MMQYNSSHATHPPRHKAANTTSRVLTNLPATFLAGVSKDLGQRKAADGGSQNLWDRLARTMQVQPVLLNKQDDTSFALATSASKAFSRRLQINTVGGKGGVRIKVQTVDMLP